jgi:CelD/BcsL family acetyltransferase involved in cellulose biosynthesis
MSYTVEKTSFNTLAPEWSQFLDSVPDHSLFQTLNWHKTWWCEFGEGYELELLAARHGGELVAIAPLMKQSDTITLAGSPNVCDYQDIIIKPGAEEAYASFLEYLEPLPEHGLELHSVPEGSETLSRLTETARERGYDVQVEREDVCPRLELPPTFDEYLASLTKKDRHELRRKMRRLAGAGRVDYYVIEEPEDLAERLDDFFRLHRESRDDKRAFMTDDMERFFRSQASWLHADGILKLYFLDIDGISVSSIICFDYGGEFLLYNSGFDLAYSSASVGLLLKAFCLRDPIELGRSAFDFLRGDEPYKYDLGGKDRAVYRCQITPRRDGNA